MGISLTGENFLEGDIPHTVLFQTFNPSKKIHYIAPLSVYITTSPLSFML